jgi:hypothetical protein
MSQDVFWVTHPRVSHQFLKPKNEQKKTQAWKTYPRGQVDPIIVDKL